MTLKNIDILVVGDFLLSSTRQLRSRFTVHDLTFVADKTGIIKNSALKIRGIASGAGHVMMDNKFFTQFPKLDIISSLGVGYDHIDAGAAARQNILVTNTPDVLNEEVADLTIGLILCTIRQLPQAEQFLRSGQWLREPFPLTATLRGRRVGIVGLGRIGKAIARRLEAFDVSIGYHGRVPQTDIDYHFYSSLTEMAAEVDLLVCVAPGGPSTHHIVNAEVLRQLGPTGILVNVGRGSVVDQHALVSALQSKIIMAAGLDVYENEPHVPAELLALPNVVLLPHVGSGSLYTREAMGQLVVDNLGSWFSGKGPITPVPETPWPKPTELASF